MTDKSLTPFEEALAQEEEEPYIPGDDVPEYPDDDPKGDRAEFIDHPMWQDIEEIPEIEEVLEMVKKAFGDEDEEEQIEVEDS